MNQMSYVSLAGMGLVVVTLVTACGVVCSPVAPEKVGVNPTIIKQKAQLQKSGTVQSADNAQDGSIAIEPMEPKGQDEELPPLRPVGTR